MSLLILRTDIKTRKKAKQIKPLLDSHPVILDWSVDTEDIDNVLRIEANEYLEEKEVTNLLKSAGFYCEPLPE